jgi:hypothetical protein
MTPGLFVTVVAPYVLLTAGLSAGLYLFYTLKAEIAMLRAECQQRTAELSAALRASEVEREDLRRDVQRVVSASGKSGSLPRDRVLQLHEQGESPAAIARSLGLPDGQVKLLLKVRRLVGETP